jgi:hypothetical protein
METWLASGRPHRGSIWHLMFRAPGTEHSRRANDEWNEALDCFAGDGGRDDDDGRLQDHGCDQGCAGAGASRCATAGSSRRSSRRPSATASAGPPVRGRRGSGQSTGEVWASAPAPPGQSSDGYCVAEAFQSSRAFVRSFFPQTPFSRASLVGTPSIICL